MAALVLAIFSSASLALIFRTTERRGYNRYVITAVNYLAAVATAVALSLESRHAAATNAVWTELPVILAIAVPGGILFFVSFILYQRSVAEWGPGPAGMYGKLGILVPMVLSMVVWQEIPAPMQWAGLVLACIAIVVSQRTGRSGDTGSFRPILLVLLLSMGFAEFSNKLFERYGNDNFRELFLAVLFAIAFAGSSLAVWRRRIRPRTAEIGWGLLVGVPNLFSSYFLIASLQTVPAAVAFPVFSAGSIAVIVLGARVIYGDTLRRRQWVAVALATAALALINIR
jgi:drug/metabolite transporter (DMT)-like permease